MTYLPNANFAGSLFLVATSNTKEGPFNVVNSNVNMTYKIAGSSALFSDDNGDGYLLYDALEASSDHVMSIEKLSYNWTQSTFVNSGKFASNVEAPSLFKKDDMYYALFGICCCFCGGGSGVQVWISENVLGPYKYVDNFNRYSNNSVIIPTQHNTIFQVNTTNNGIQYIWSGDRWQSALDGLKGHDFTYWQPMIFNGTNIEKNYWMDQFELDVVL